MTRRTTPANRVGPVAIGPYSPSSRIGDLIAVAGQAGIDPATGLVVGPDISAQTDQALANIAAILAAAGASLDDVISMRVFLIDLADFDAMNSAYREHFTKPYPARATVAVGLPDTMRIEIEALAVARDESEVDGVHQV